LTNWVFNFLGGGTNAWIWQEKTRQGRSGLYVGEIAGKISLRTVMLLKELRKDHNGLAGGDKKVL
jgi:hypothetical protein